MRSTKIVAVVLAAGLLTSISAAVRAAPATFAQALADFNAGRNKEALAKFVDVDKPGQPNMTVHFYMGVCYQRLGKVTQAKAEYKYVADNADAALKPYAQRALNALNSATANNARGFSNGNAARGWPDMPDPGQPGSPLSVVTPTQTPGQMQVAPVPGKKR